MFFYVYLFSWNMNFVNIWPVFIFPNIVKKKISSVFNFAKSTKFAKNIHAKISALNAHRFSFSQKLLYTKSCSGWFRLACLNVLFGSKIAFSVWTITFGHLPKVTVSSLLLQAWIKLLFSCKIVWKSVHYLVPCCHSMVVVYSYPISQPAWDVSERSQSDLHWERYLRDLSETSQKGCLFCDVFKTSQKHFRKDVFCVASLRRLGHISTKMSFPWRLWDVSKTSLASSFGFPKIRRKNDFVWFP